MKQSERDPVPALAAGALAAAVLVSMLAACSSDDGDSNGDGGTPTTTTTTTTSIGIGSTTSTTMGGRVHACCIPGQACRGMREGACLAMGGEWEPPGSDPLCTPGLCLGRSTTTTSTVATSTSTITDEFGVNVRVALLDGVTLGALQLDIANNGPGQFEGQAATVSCTIDGFLFDSIVSFNHDVAQSTLRVGIISLGGFTGPGDLFECRYTRSFGVNGAQFPVTVVDATTTDFAPIVPVPSIALTLGGYRRQASKHDRSSARPH